MSTGTNTSIGPMNIQKAGVNMTSEQIAATIKQRRLQLLVHSCIYYEFNQSIVDDVTWVKWAIELEQLQMAYPVISDKVEWAEAFKDFDHSTGYNLPVRDPWVMRKARQIMIWHERMNNNDAR